MNFIDDIVSKAKDAAGEHEGEIDKLLDEAKTKISGSTDDSIIEMVKEEMDKRLHS